MCFDIFVHLFRASVQQLTQTHCESHFPDSNSKAHKSTSVPCFFANAKHSELECSETSSGPKDAATLSNVRNPAQTAIRIDSSFIKDYFSVALEVRFVNRRKRNNLEERKEKTPCESIRSLGAGSKPELKIRINHLTIISDDAFCNQVIYFLPLKVSD